MAWGETRIASNKTGNLRSAYHHEFEVSVLVALIVCTAGVVPDDGIHGEDQSSTDDFRRTMSVVRISSPKPKRRDMRRDARKDSAMNRWLLIGSLAGLLIGSTGCMQHSLRGGCASGGCASGACSTDGCNNGACGNSCQSGNSTGLLGKLCGGGCGHCGGRAGCQAGPLGWQQGGLDYSSHLNPGLLGHDAPSALNNRPFTPGPPTAHVGYPYYTVRGPRDFLMDNPPSIGR